MRPEKAGGAIRRTFPSVDRDDAHPSGPWPVSHMPRRSRRQGMPADAFRERRRMNRLSWNSPKAGELALHLHPQDPADAEGRDAGHPDRNGLPMGRNCP